MQSERGRQRRGRTSCCTSIFFANRVDGAVVGAFVSSQVEPAKRCRAPRASVGSQIEPACALLGAQVARAGRNGLASCARTSVARQAWSRNFDIDFKNLNQELDDKFRFFIDSKDASQNWMTSSGSSLIPIGLCLQKCKVRQKEIKSRRF